jgi:hypothetical protein
MAMILMGSGVSFAGVSVTCAVDESNITLADTILLECSLAITGRVSGSPRWTPPVFEKDWLSYGNGKRVSSNGSTQEQIHWWRLQPKRLGKLSIGASKIQANNKVLSQSKPLTVIVTATKNQKRPTKPTAQKRVTPGSASLQETDEDNSEEEQADEYAFLQWSVDRDSVWLGEAISAQLFIYYRSGLRVHQFNHGKIDLSGFWNEEAKGDSGRTDKMEIDGRIYVRSEIARYTLYPTRAGSLSLPSIETEMELAKSSFFSRGRSTAIQRTVPALPITVRALPTRTRPKNYRGMVVGKTRVTAELDRKRIRASEGVELTVEMRIEGLMQDVPEFELPSNDDFRSFPSTTKTQQIRRGKRLINLRRQVWLLRPLKSGKLKIKPFSLDYFDPQKSRYVTARTRSLTVQVTGKPKAQVGSAKEEKTGESGIKLHSIREKIDVNTISQGNESPIWLLIALLGSPGLLILLFGIGRLRAHRDSTAGNRAARTAAGAAEAALNQIQVKGDISDAYGQIHAVIFGYLSTRFMQSFKGKTYQQLVQMLAGLGVSHEVGRGLTDQLEAIDFARFARAGDEADLKGTIEQTQALVRQIDEAAP